MYFTYVDMHVQREAAAPGETAAGLQEETPLRSQSFIYKGESSHLRGGTVTH